MRPQTSPIRRRHDGGFTLIEMVCVLAIISIAAALVTPVLKGRSAELASISMSVGAVLKEDRSAALFTRKKVRTIVDPSARIVRSGLGNRFVSIPADIHMQTILAHQCGGLAEGRTIDFFPNGLSCGGVIRLEKDGLKSEIRVNWLTGAVDVLSGND